MSASTQDKITDTRNAARPNSARVTSGRSAGGTTLACDNLAGWPDTTKSKVHFVTYKIDSNSAVVAGSQYDCYGIVSGNNIGSFTVVDGTDTGHAVGDVVEMLPTAAWGQDLADALSVGHTRTGAHSANLPLTTPILTTPTIANFTSATHTHATADQGGQLTGSTALVNSTVTADKLSTGAANTTVATSETTTSTTYAALSTAGPAVTCTVGANGLLLVGLYSEMSNNTANAFCEMSFDLSGANTLSAADTLALRFQAYTGGAIDKRGATFLLTGLTAGSTTVTAKYSVQTGGAGSGTGTFQDRRLFAVPL